MSFGAKIDEEALQTDVYLDRLLARAVVLRAVTAEGEMPSPGSGVGPEIAPDLATTAHALSRTLVRFHPSFGFEERLAGRLRHGGSDQAVQRPTPLFRSLDLGPAPAAHGRGLLVGGAIASGVSLASAALFAWRRGHAGGPAQRRRSRLSRPPLTRHRSA